MTRQSWLWGFRLGWVLLFVGLSACSGGWPMLPGGYVDLTSQCTEDAQCQKLDPNRVCEASICVCAANRQTCEALCVDLKADPQHCGSCKSACEQGSSCCDGKCCAPGNSCCGGACVELDTSPTHCGACGNKCPDNAACCQGKCVAIDDNNLSCGGCGIQCAAAIAPLVQERKQAQDGEKMSFTFSKVVPPSSFATMTLQIDLYGSYANLLANASIFINDIEQGLMQGGSQCNQRRVPGHSKRFSLPKSALKDGTLQVRVELSPAVLAARCNNPRVVVSLSFGLDQCCSGTCVDVVDNVEHCGACGKACETGAVCCDSACCPIGYDCCTGGCCRSLHRTGDDALTSISSQHTGKYIMIASESGIWGWQFETGQYVGLIQVTQGATLFDDIAFHPKPPNGDRDDNTFVAAVSKKQTSFSMMVGKLRDRLHQIIVTLPQVTSALQSVAWSADGGYFFLGSTNGEIHFVQANNLAGNSTTWRMTYLAKIQNHTQPILRLKTSRNGQWLGSVSTDRKVTLLEIGKLPAATIPVRTIVSSPGTNISDIAMHPDGKQVAIALLFDDLQEQDKSYIEVRDLSKGDAPTLITLQDVGSVVYLAYSPDGSKLAVGTLQGDIQIWDMEKKSVLAVFRGHNARILRLVFHPDGKSLASISLDRGIRIWALPGTP